MTLLRTFFSTARAEPQDRQAEEARHSLSQAQIRVEGLIAIPGLASWFCFYCNRSLRNGCYDMYPVILLESTLCVCESMMALWFRLPYVVICHPTDPFFNCRRFIGKVEQARAVREAASCFRSCQISNILATAISFQSSMHERDRAPLRLGPSFHQIGLPAQCD